MKTTWEIRKQLGILPKINPDSEYKPIERTPKVFSSLKVSKALMESLPFKSKEKVQKLSRKQVIERQEAKLPIKSLTSEKEKQFYSLI